MNMPLPPVRRSRWSRAHRGLCLFVLVLLLGAMAPLLTPSQVQAQGAISCSSVTQIPQAECEALVALYTGTGGATWTNRTNWLVTTSPCSWYGISCFWDNANQISRVYSVSLSSNKVSGALPPELGDLSALRYLYLYNNQVTSVPPQIGALEQLYWLDLRYNRLGSLPLEFFSLPSLQQLYLSNNQLTSLPPQIGGLDNLYTLDVRYNRLAGLPLEIFSLPSLQNLYLAGNLLSVLPPAIANLMDLRTLELGYTQITQLPDELFTLRTLESLSLAGLRLGTLPSGLFTLGNLRYLSVSGNQLASVPSELGELANLQTLDLNNNLLTDLPSSLFTLGNLVGLYVSGNQLVSLPDAVGDLTKLQILEVANNRLASLPTTIGSLGQLRSLNLGNNQLVSMPSEVGSLASLQALYLYNNRLIALPVEIGNLGQLRILYAGGNQLVSVPSELGSLANLQTLDLNNNHLASLPTTIGSLGQLRYLSLGSNQLESLPSQLFSLANLQTLNLYSNRLASLPVEIGNLTQLSNLYLYYNPQLAGALPSSLTNLNLLRYFYFHSTKLCVPDDTAFQTWLAGVAQRGSVGSTNIVCGPPTANTTGPYTVAEGGTVQLQGLGTDPYGGLLTYAWDLDGDGSYESAGQSIAYSAAGMSGPAQQSVALQVCNPQQQCATAQTLVTITNQAPVANAGPDQFGILRSALVTLLGTWTDSAGALDAPYTWNWDVTGDGAVDSSGTADYNTPVEQTTAFAGEGHYRLTFAVQDKDGGQGSDAVMVEVINRAPQVVVALDPITVDEGTLATNQGTVTDEDGDLPSLTATLGELLVEDTQWSWQTAAQEGPLSQQVTLVADDGHGGYAQASFDLVVNNVAPAIGRIQTEAGVVPLGSALVVAADFQDPGTLDTHTAIWDWGDGSTSQGTIEVQNELATVGGSHAYSNVGIYKVSLTVSDDDGGSDSASYAYAVVYDPSAGFVTGGGWIVSPPGAYAAAPALTGRASFGFVAKYKKGATAPEGQTEFQFKAGDLNFHSSSYEWLVVAGAHAKYKGVGTINGSGNYGFMLTATDGAINGDGSDTFRIKIWDKDNGDTVVYDNQMGKGDDLYDGTTLSGGSIVIHDGGKGGKNANSSALDETAGGHQQVFLPVVND